MRHDFFLVEQSIIIATSIAEALHIELTHYKPIASLWGMLKRVGLDTMLPEVELSAEGFTDM